MIDATRLRGVTAYRAGRHQEALQLLRQVAENTRSTPGDHSNLGAVYRALGQAAQAEAQYRRALAIDPDFVAGHTNLGNLLSETNRLAEAAASYRRAISLQPDHADAWHSLGLVLQRDCQLADAAAAFRQAVRHAPRHVDARTSLGVALLGLEQFDAAEAALRAAIALQPWHAPAHGNLGALYLWVGRAMQAEAACRAALALQPDEHRWHANLAVALQSQGRHAETEACYRKALALRPDYARGHSNLLFALNYRPDLTAEQIFAEYRNWDAAQARPVAPAARPFALDRTPGRRLRIGYVSPDFRNHAVAFFIEPILAAHDRAAVELFCYAEQATEDETTARLRGLAEHWRATMGRSDDAVAEMIRADGIDVLVDLAGHTADSRLLVFARRPAPVQISYLIGHGTTSGLSAMDGFLADRHLAPPGSEHLFSEELRHLPRIPLAYRPPAEMPAVASLPALAKFHVTFGYFGRTERLNDGVVAAWSRILHAVPGSRLMLNSRPFQEAAFGDMIAARFAAHGIDPARLDLIFTAPQPCTWAAYGDIDIALDPFPHNAGTTTIEALWLGVPVVNLAGQPGVGRFGASILNALDLDDWVTQDVDGYVARAVAAASDLPALASLREGLRRRVIASPLHDATGLTRLLEEQYRALWDEWREGEIPRLHRLYAADPAACRELAERLLRRDPDHAEALHVLALLELACGHLEAADRRMRQAIALTQDRVELHSNHAAVLRRRGHLAAAEAAARRALALDAGRAEAHNNLGNILRDASRHAESIGCFQAATALSPGFADAWSNMAWVLSLNGQAHRAEAAALRAIACDGNHADAHNNLGLALMRQSRLREAEAALRRAMALRPGSALSHSNILFCLNYRPDVSPEAISREYRNWDAAHARHLAPCTPPVVSDRTPGRRLRIGYVSPDFRNHAVAFFIEPILAAHDRAQVEVFCYAEVTIEDATTARLRDHAAQWRSTIGQGDAELAETIRADAIDVLVDLAGHTAGNRLLVFARRPAPVQISYLVGHGTTSGLSAMDGFLADEFLAPPGCEHLFSERLLRLPRTPLAYRPPAEMPEVAPLPASTKGHITFGHFGRTVRLNDNVVAAWSRILHALPAARLVLNSAPFAEADGRDGFAARFAAHGIDPGRIDLIFTSPQPRTWAAYGDIDIALDPFPHNAGTTTIEALWLGVPVLTLAGRPSVGRFGASILHALDLDDWVTRDVDAYVARAVAAASDLTSLAALRSGLRRRCIASPLHDAVGLTRLLEAQYRKLWTERVS